MTRLNALASTLILSTLALALIPGAEVEAAVARVDEPACVGFNGQALGLCIEGCRMTEEGRVSIRHTRHEARNTLQSMQREGEIGEDDCHRAMDELQDMTDEHINRLAEVLEKKEAEVMEV